MKDKSIIEIKPTQVTLFSNGAQITKLVNLKLEKGTNKILISGLPYDIVPESIHVSSDKSVNVLSVTHQINYNEVQDVADKTKKLQEKLEKVEVELAEKNGNYEVSLQEIEMLLMGRDLSSSKEQFKVEEYRQAVDFFSQKMKEIKSEQIKLQSEIRKLDEERNRLYQEIGNASTTGQPVSEVFIELYSELSEAEIVLEYYTRLAGWNVKYDIRVEEVEHPANLVMKAEVYQNTGEDWSDIQLTLSSGNPTLGAVQPHLQPWHLDFIQPIQDIKSYDMEEAWNVMEVKEMAVERPMMKMSRNFEPRVETQVNHGQASIEFQLPATVTVLTNEPPKTLEVLKHQLEAEYKYYNIRKLDKDTFLLAVIKGWQQLNLLEGPVSIFLESTYVGKTYLNPREIEEELEVSLGRDRSILVTRVKGSDFKSKTMFGGNIKETRSFDLTVRNTKNKAIRIELIDQIPVSVNKEISIELVDSSDAILDKDTGKLTWKCLVEEGHSQVFSVKYVVTYPQDKKIILD